jgi:hypothetical protein
MSDEANEKLATPELRDALNAWLDAPSGDEATNERLASAVSKVLAPQRLPSGRPLQNVTSTTDLVTERGTMTDNIGQFPRPTRDEPRGEFPRHSDRVGQLLTGPEALALARKHLADWIAEHRDCEIRYRAGDPRGD